ncbi:dephospho-CoA kinase [Bacillus sp. DJP31]|uniref:dephospho-CoA kinase n=1 Tax=Bacillus sp. DJP31 TaxID=3409789 RepID=UPI003BB7BA36
MGVTIGLTGGIASGKSTVSNMLRELGFPIIDADIIAREVVVRGEPAYEAIIAVFGNEVVEQDGTIDRAKMGSIIFQDEEKRKMLNSIVHPAIRKRMTDQKEQYLHSGFETVILDIPLLFESKLTYMVNKTIVVYVDFDLQLDRLMTRNSLTEAEARARISSQMPLLEKKELADDVITNNGTLQETKKQLMEILKKWNVN